MAPFDYYILFTSCKIFTALIAGAASSWILTNSDADVTPKYHHDIWLDLHLVAFISWSTIVISILQILVGHSGLWAQAIASVHRGVWINIVAGYLFSYSVLWGSAALALTIHLPGSCSNVQHCTQTRSMTAFCWLTLISFFVNDLVYGALYALYVQRSEILLDDWAYWPSDRGPKPIVSTIPAPAVATKTPQVNQRQPSLYATATGIQCIQCARNVCAPNSVFCGHVCVSNARSGAPKLIALPAGHYMFQILVASFNAAWRHPTPKPTIHYIYVIVNTEETDRQYRRYNLPDRDGLEAVNQFAEHGMQPGNEQFRWHGTVRECLVGEGGNQVLCESPACGVCGIIRTSFDIEKYGQKWGRYGKGIYTSETSSKSNDYQSNTLDSVFHALLLNNVIIGTGYTIQENDPSLTEPPEGHHSILGTPGSQLNYDETVVYRNDAIRPAYLIIYTEN